MTAAHVVFLQPASHLLLSSESRDRLVLAPQHHRVSPICSRSRLGTMQLAGAHYSYEIQPAELDSYSSCSHAAHEGRLASPLDMPPSLRLGPRVEHVKVVQDGRITERLSEALSLSPEYIQRLIKFGAVYYCPIHPLPPQQLAADTPEGRQQLAAAQAARLAGAARHGKSPTLSVPRRVVDDCDVHQYGYCRVHVHPKRFSLAYTTNWKERVIVNEDEYVVLNKPPGVQVTPTVDNLLECCLTLGAKAVGRDEPLLITHRLDTCTEGVLIMGRKKEFVQRFNASMMAKGSLKKTYRALTRVPLSPGVIIDYVFVRQRQPGSASCTVVLEHEQPNSLRCELEIIAVEEVHLTGDAAEQWGDLAFEHTIDLRTGRTHQIRAQLAAAGAPLLGDHLYGDEETAPVDVPLMGDTPAAAQGKRDVTQPIGLQAYQLRVSSDTRIFGPDNMCFTAPTPWWRV